MMFRLPFFFLILSLATLLLPSLSGHFHPSSDIDADVSVSVHINVNENVNDDHHEDPHAESESALSSSPAPTHTPTPSPNGKFIELPPVYHFISTYHSSSNNVIQPTEFWMDSINMVNRVEHFHGDDFTITRGDKNGTNYNVGFQNGVKKCLQNQDLTQVGKNVTTGTPMDCSYFHKMNFTQSNVPYKFVFGPKKGQTVMTNQWDYAIMDKSAANRLQWVSRKWLVDPKTNFPILYHSSTSDNDKRDKVIDFYFYEFSLFEASLGTRKNLFSIPTAYGKCYETNFNNFESGYAVHSKRLVNFTGSDETIYSLEREKLEAQYADYLAFHGKTADTDNTNHLLRKKAFIDSVHQVQIQNLKYHKGQSSYKLKVSARSDALPSEKKSHMGVNPSLLSSDTDTILGSKTLWGFEDKDQVKIIRNVRPKGFDRWEPKNFARPDLRPSLYVRFYEPTGKPLPEKVDWRTEIPGNNIVGPIHDQGNCGSCWAFSATHVISSQWAKQHGHYQFFSVNELIDCSWDFGNNGCIGGGDAVVAQTWVAARGGLYSQHDYANDAYKAQTGKCHTKEMDTTHPHAVKVEVVGTEVIHSPADILDALAFRGPVAIEMNWIDALSDYGGGVLSVDSEKDCPGDVDHLSHAILAIGYGKDEKTGKDYLLIWNQWGAFWGDEEDPSTAKVYFPRDGSVNTCGIVTAASIPVLKGSEEEKRLRKEWEEERGNSSPPSQHSPVPISDVSDHHDHKGKKGPKATKPLHSDHA